jgi:hypothetical protein
MPIEDFPTALAAAPTNPAEPAFVVLAMLLGVAGFSLSASASAFPPLPRFRLARRQITTLAALSLAASLALLSWVVRA